MSQVDYIDAEIDPNIKAEAAKVLASFGLTVSEACRLFLTKVALEKNLPFDHEIPNELTERTMAQVERGEELHRAKDVNDLFTQLSM